MTATASDTARMPTRKKERSHSPTRRQGSAKSRRGCQKPRRFSPAIEDGPFAVSIGAQGSCALPAGRRSSHTWTLTKGGVPATRSIERDRIPSTELAILTRRAARDRACEGSCLRRSRARRQTQPGGQTARNRPKQQRRLGQQRRNHGARGSGGRTTRPRQPGCACLCRDRNRRRDRLVLLPFQGSTAADADRTGVRPIAGSRGVCRGVADGLPCGARTAGRCANVWAER